MPRSRAVRLTPPPCAEPHYAEPSLHRDLAAFNRERLTPTLPGENPGLDLGRDLAIREREIAMVERERAAVAPAARAAPSDPDGFIEWFENLVATGPGQGDALFPWLATVASKAEMRWFLSQEVAGEAGFDDLVALTQIKQPTRPKLEMARNYWDEMGCGNAKGMHGPMLGRLAAAFDIGDDQADIVWESLALGNVMIALAANRSYAYHSVGALGAIELTAPSRAGFVAAGLKRLGAPAKARTYFDLHAVLDIRHAAAWNREVIRPLVAADPRVAPAIAEGALMRLVCGARCFARYRAVLNGSAERISVAA